MPEVQINFVAHLGRYAKSNQCNMIIVQLNYIVIQGADRYQFWVNIIAEVHYYNK